MRDAVLVFGGAGSLPGRCSAVGQLDAYGFVYASTPFDADADFATEPISGRAVDAVDGCAAGDLDGSLGSGFVVRVLGRRSVFYGGRPCLSAVRAQKETAGGPFVIISL